MKPLIRVKRNRDIQFSFTFVMPEDFEFVMSNCTVDPQRRTITPTTDQAVFMIRRKEVEHDRS